MGGGISYVQTVSTSLMAKLVKGSKNRFATSKTKIRENLVRFIAVKTKASMILQL